VPIGEWKFFYPNGNIHAIGSYAKDGKQGLWKLYDPLTLYGRKALLEKNEIVEESTEKLSKKNPRITIE